MQNNCGMHVHLKKQSKADLVTWKNRFSSVQCLNDYLDEDCSKDHANFTSTLAQLGMRRCDSESFESECNRLYRWQRRSCVTLNGSSATSVMKDYIEEDYLQDDPAKNHAVFPEGYSLVLQLHVKNKWQDYFYIGNSKIIPGQLGLFACREFQNNTIIGWYVGDLKWGPSDPGSGHCHVDITEIGGSKSSFSMSVRDNNGGVIIIEPRLLPNERKSDNYNKLYMGLHYAIDGSMTFNDKRKKRKLKSMNVRILPDGSFQATKKIKKNFEISAMYEGFFSKNIEGTADQKAGRIMRPEDAILAEKSQDNSNVIDDDYFQATKKLKQDIDIPAMHDGSYSATIEGTAEGKVVCVQKCQDSSKAIDDIDKKDGLSILSAIASSEKSIMKN